MSEKYKFTICGDTYVITTQRDERYITALTRELEQRITEIAQVSGKPPHKAAVMLCLSLLDEVKISSEKIDGIRTQIKLYVDEAGKARNARDEGLRQIDKLHVRITELERKLQQTSLFEEEASAAKNQRDAALREAEKQRIRAERLDAELEELKIDSRYTKLQ
ncbi:MAG: cell division protein ZapA [Oscillospiraceae bacterium]|nr:cell division protein ZapA [Oscillospiraceae bacterium]